MSPEIEKYLALLERRLFLLRALAQQLEGCRKEFVAMDLDGMYGRIFEQEELCRQIQSFHPAMVTLQRTCAQQLNVGSPDAASRAEDADCAERLRVVMRELAEAQGQVRHLSRIHEAYLRRSLRAVNVMMNLLGSYSFGYAQNAKNNLPAPRIMEKG